ncbi:MAG TPA: T9SS type A sorting domain-containing protein [Bacteroidia bacterium]|nr:T9SS type A sorting domain-containing protein [Bacteroidia bacterium]
MKMKTTAKLILLSFITALSVNVSSAQTWTSIATDPSGDAGTGLDAIDLSFFYDDIADVINFRIECTNLSSFSSGPAADFSFYLPNGLDGGFGTGYHWTAPTTPVHKIASVYCDPGGSAPNNYTFSTYDNNVVRAVDNGILCSGCIGIDVDIANNWMIFTMSRTNVITDTEMNGTTATIGIVANAGHDLGWDDNIVDNGSFVLDLATGISNNENDRGVKIFPSISRGTVHVHLPGSLQNVEKITVSNMVGQTIRDMRSDLSGNVDLDTYDFAEGIYFVSVTLSDQSLITKKFIVVK